MNMFFPSLFVTGFFVLFAYAQQNYSGNSALDCYLNDEAGPSPAFLYTCNDQNRRCKSFLIFISQLHYASVPNISALLSVNEGELARINNVTRLAEFPINKEVIVPVTCSCFSHYYQANTTFNVTSFHQTYYLTAQNIYEGLSTCASLMRANPYNGEFDFGPGVKLQVPLRCACPTTNQAKNGTKYLLTYHISPGDKIPDIAERFNVNIERILEANGLDHDSTIYPDTTILIPLPSQPSSFLVIFHDNPHPEISPPSNFSPQNRRSNRKLYEYLGLAAACSLLVFGIILFTVFLLYKIRRDKTTRSNDVWPEELRAEIASFERAFKIYAIEEVRKATENFSPKCRITDSVYRGEFGGEVLVVKRMSRNVLKEVNILKKINHFNLIKLQGVCENRGCLYLVFEYMKNGSLREWLSGERFKDTDSWSQRIQIALDVANGLHYLHSFTEPAYVHKDINSSNILLNGKLRAKVANFGLARESTNTALTKHVVGTRGYMAPEYVQAGQVSPKIDVYAFGVVLLELITGRDAIFIQDGTEVVLSKVIASIMEKEGAEAELTSFLDLCQKESKRTKFTLCLVKVSLACLTQEPARRPTMEEVVSILLKVQADSRNQNHRMLTLLSKKQ